MLFLFFCFFPMSFKIFQYSFGFLDFKLLSFFWVILLYFAV